MGLNCGATCAKYVLFAFNIIFFIGGAAVLGVGIWIRVDTGSYMDFLTRVDPTGSTADVTGNILSDNISYIHTMAYILIGVGAFVFVVGFMGCCGAIKQWRPLLVGYAICLMIIMCLQVGVGIAVGVKKDEILIATTNELKNWARSYGYRDTQLLENAIVPLKTAVLDANNTQVGATNGWNAMQVYLQCCGAKDYLDFQSSPYWNTAQVAPVFCCRMDAPAKLYLGGNSACFNQRTDANSYMNMGCVRRVESFVEDNAPAVIGVAVGIGLIELVGIIFAFCLCCAIGDHSDKGMRYN